MSDRGFPVSSDSRTLFARKRSHSPPPGPRKRSRSRSPGPSNDDTQKGLIYTANEQCREIFYNNNRGYEEVHFLGLHWEDEHPGFRDEAERLADCFKTKFQFTTSLFAIPTEYSMAKLNAKIAIFVSEFSGPRKLLIVYYGGHGLENTCDKRQALWVRSKSHNKESAVDWYNIQGLLLSSMEDVVVIIDACYSAEAARGSTSSQKMELLTSASMRCKCPAPGPDSYTSRLIETMKNLLEKKGGFSISTLNRSLEQASARLQQTPHYSDLTANDQRSSIFLRPLNSGISSPGSDNREPRVYVNILVGLSEEPDESLLPILSDWFRQAPRGLTGSMILDFLKDDTKTPFGGAVSIKALQQAQKQHSETYLAKAVLQRWRDHKKSKLSVVDKHPTFQLQVLDESQDKLAGIKLEDVSPISASSGMEIFQDELPLLDEGTIIFGNAADEENIPTPLWQNPNGTETLEPNWSRQPHARFSYGNLNYERVIVEYKDYPIQQDIEEFEKRIRKEIKAPEEDNELSIPRCVGYIKDSKQRRFGLVYYIPPEASSHTTLYDEIYNENSIPIEHRLKLARTMARTALHFQRNGWYHGSISSKNVLFFNNDYSRPYLFGIGECAYQYQGLLSSPSSEVGTWSSTGFTYGSVCDIRGLGSLLHAVGLWKPENTTTPPQLTETSIKKLEHSMGTNYRKAIEICFGGFSKVPSASVLFGNVHQLLDNALRWG